MANTFISALHARFEANGAEFDRIDQADGDTETAKHQSMCEADAIRYAILAQVPSSWPDALILQFHIQLDHQFQVGADREPDAEERLQLAMETLFDFMACEVEADHGEIGTLFQASCNRVFYARHHRTGDMI
jgi:hypothetical protein